MALLSAEALAGPGYIILNVMRALNIIALASVVASSVVMLVKTFIVSKVRLPQKSPHSTRAKLTMPSSSSLTPPATLSPLLSAVSHTQSLRITPS
jgi:hypothetical protein